MTLNILSIGTVSDDSTAGHLCMNVWTKIRVRYVNSANSSFKSEVTLSTGGSSAANFETAKLLQQTSPSKPHKPSFSENSSQSQLIAKEELKTRDVEVNKTTKTTSKFSYSQTNGPTDNDDSVNFNNR